MPRLPEKDKRREEPDITPLDRKSVGHFLSRHAERIRPAMEELDRLAVKAQAQAPSVVVTNGEE